MTAPAKFAMGFEFQTNPPYANHAAAGYARDYVTNNPVVVIPSNGPGFSTILSNISGLSKYPFATGRISVYENDNVGAFFSVSKGSGTVASGLTWMGGDVSYSCEVLGFALNSASLGDTPWFTLNASNGTRFYSNKFQSFKSQWQVKDSGGTRREIQESTSSSYNTWNHWVCVVQAGTSGTWKIYRNNSESASATWTYGNIAAPDLWSMCNASNTQTGTSLTGFQCRFIRFYNGVLDATEVSELYNSGSYRDIDYINPNWRNNSQCKLDNGSIQVRV